MNVKNKFDLKKYKKDKKMIGVLYIGFIIIFIIHIILLCKTNEFVYGVSLVAFVSLLKLIELESNQKYILKKLEME